MKNFIVASSLIVLVAVTLTADARGDDTVVKLRFENHRFTPQTITVPANQPFKIKVINGSKETIEFESFKLNRERVAGPGETIIISLPALKPGSYDDFYDDFHQDVPEGSITAK